MGYGFAHDGGAKTAMVNNFDEGVERTTPARGLAERHLEGVRLQGGMFVEAVRVTRMPMMVTDAMLPGNPIIFANEAFITLSGYPMEELLGQDPHFMNGDDTDSAAIDSYEASMEEGRDATLEILQYRKDGSPFRAMLFATPLGDGQGTVTNHFLSYLDISCVDRKDPRAALIAAALLWSGVANVARAPGTAEDISGQLGSNPWRQVDREVTDSASHRIKPAARKASSITRPTFEGPTEAAA